MEVNAVACRGTEKGVIAEIAEERRTAEGDGWPALRAGWIERKR
jgi:hypothetical protein